MVLMLLVLLLLMMLIVTYLLHCIVTAIMNERGYRIGVPLQGHRKFNATATPQLLTDKVDALNTLSARSPSGSLKRYFKRKASWTKQ